MEVLGDLAVLWVTDHSHVSGGHHGWNLNGSIFCIWSHVNLFLVGWCPLVSAGWTLGQFPCIFVLEEHVKVAVVPLDWVGSPCTFDTTGNGVSANARLVVARPAKSLFFEGCTLRFRAFVVFRTSTVCLSEGVTACCEGNGFFVVHGHAAKCFTNVLSTEKWVWVCVWTLWVNVDEPHLNCSKRVLKILASVAVSVVSKPLIFATPIDVIFRVPDVRSATTETEDRAAHGFDSDLAGKDEQVSPTDGITILLLDWPQQASSLVEVSVVRPAVERCKSLCTSSATASTVAGSVGSGSVPGHSNEEWTVVTIVSRPPILTVRHQCVEVFLETLVVKTLEGFSIIEISPHWVGFLSVLMEDVEVEILWPPILV